MPDEISKLRRRQQQASARSDSMLRAAPIRMLQALAAAAHSKSDRPGPAGVAHMRFAQRAEAELQRRIDRR